VKSPVFFVATCLLASGCASGASALDDGTGGANASSGGATGGGVASGGAHASGGTSAGGTHSGGASSSGGSTTGGAASGGFFGGGGIFGSGGSFGSGGDAASGGAASGGTASLEIDCDAQMPTGGEDHHSNNLQSGSGNTAWSIWTNSQNGGDLTTFGETPAFRAAWSNSGDYLGRIGFEWGNSGKPYTEYGTIKADYVWNKATGGNADQLAGGYSYVGVYGWSNNPCVEWYIVEDSFHNMPFNTGNQPSGTTEIDGGTYNLVYRTTPGTGGSRCGGTASWEQFYSIRHEGKRCGTITVSDHFAAWAAQGWDLGNLLEVKIFVESASGTGYVDFPLARVSTSAGN